MRTMVPGDILIDRWSSVAISMQTAGYALHRGCLCMRASWSMMSLGSGGAGNCIRPHHQGYVRCTPNRGVSVAVLRKPAMCHVETWILGVVAAVKAKKPTFHIVRANTMA
jgi:hypothetical protein